MVPVSFRGQAAIGPQMVTPAAPGQVPAAEAPDEYGGRKEIADRQEPVGWCGKPEITPYRAQEHNSGGDGKCANPRSERGSPRRSSDERPRQRVRDQRSGISGWIDAADRARPPQFVAP